MKTIVFDGRAFAAKKEKELKVKVIKLKRKGIFPKLVTILVGNNPASKLFVEKKKEVGQRIGVVVEILKLDESVCIDELIHRYKKLNSDKSIHGIMIQLPLPEKFSDRERGEIINSIAKNKDVDGMREDSPYLAPTTKAVIYVLKEMYNLLPLKVRPCKVVVAGYTGFEGRKIYKALKENACLPVGRVYDVEGVDIKTKNLKKKTLTADVLISVTGVGDLIKQSMVKEGCVLIDVGAPNGDIEKKAYKKASFVSPVPGGVGPVTIISLLENLIEAC